MTKIFGDTREILTNTVTLITSLTASRAVTDGLGILSEIAGAITTDGSEQNIYVNEAPAGVYVPRTLKIDCTSHTAGETIVIREYYRIETGGAYLEHDELTFAGAIAEDGITVHLDPNRYGIKVTIEKTAGNNRAYVWEVTYEV